MANLEETAVWTPGVYQLETTDPVLGGPVQPEPATGGIANRAALALANRTVYLKAQLELKANSDAPLASFNGSLPYARLTEVPTSFTASPHQHAWADVTGKPAQATRWPKWNEVTDKPDSFAVSPHQHAWDDVTGKPAQATRWPTWSEVNDKPTSFAASPHQHAWADVTGKPAQATRWPKWSEVTGKPDSFGPQVVTLATLPTTNVGPVIVADVAEVWVWVSTPYYTGYRSPLCGRPVDGHTIAPLANEIDAVGGLLSKSAYAGLWGYAQENNLVVSQSVWADNLGAHWFVDVSDSQFRVPDLRNQFRRFTGTNVDGGGGRGLGTRQLDATQLVTGSFGRLLPYGYANGAFAVTSNAGSLAFYPDVNGNNLPAVNFDNSRVARTAAETRPANVAFHPRIHL